MRPSTAHPEALPGIDELRRLTQSLAMLDAILSLEWEYRYYSFNATWAPHEQMASMRDGSGSEWFALFLPTGVAIKGCAHEGVISGKLTFHYLLRKVIPEGFEAFVNDPAFSNDYASFCLWRKYTDAAWTVAPLLETPCPMTDESAEILGILDGKPETYQEFAEEYYDRAVSLEAVKAIYAHIPMSKEIAAALNREAIWTDLQADAGEIGYPIDLQDRSPM